MNGPQSELNFAQPVAASCPPAESIHNDGLSFFPNLKTDPYARSRFSKKRDKVCSHCKQLLPINQFKKKSGRHSGRFKVCHACFDQIQRKVCPRCKTSLHFSQFPKIDSGRSAVCVECAKSGFPNAPNPFIRCGQCLFGLGFGYERISRQLFGNTDRKRKIAEWRKRHQWQSPFDNFKCALKSARHAYLLKHPDAKKHVKKLKDPIYLKNHKRRRVYLRCKVWQFLKHGLHPKSTATLIGCNRKQFISYLTTLLQPGMTFENYGPVWHLDHIIPCKFFDLRQLDQRLLCFHHTNLQPMFARANLKKSASLPPFEVLNSHLETLKILALSAQTELRLL